MKEKIKTLCLGLFGIIVFAAMLVAAAVESIVHALQSIQAL